MTLLYSFFYLPLKLFIDLFIKVRFKVRVTICVQLVIVTIDCLLLNGYLLQLLLLLNKKEMKNDQLK